MEQGKHQSLPQILKIFQLYSEYKAQAAVVEVILLLSVQPYPFPPALALE
jgi:hypothetical protein